MTEQEAEKKALINTGLGVLGVFSGVLGLGSLIIFFFLNHRINVMNKTNERYSGFNQVIYSSEEIAQKVQLRNIFSILMIGLILVSAISLAIAITNLKKVKDTITTGAPNSIRETFAHASEQPKEGTVKYSHCPECGATLQVGAKKCDFCNTIIK